MSYVIAKRESLFDSTGKWVGMLDLDGREHIVVPGAVPPYTRGESSNLYDSTGAFVGVLDRLGREQILATGAVPPYTRGESETVFNIGNRKPASILGLTGKPGPMPILRERLTVSGRRLLDKNGTEVTLRGINQGTWGENSEGDAAAIKALGANCVRTVFRWWGSYGTPDIDSRLDSSADFLLQSNLDQLLKEMRWLEAQGLWIVLAFDSNCGQNGLQDAGMQAYCDPAGQYPTTGRNFWSDRTTRSFFKAAWKRLAIEAAAFERVAMFEILPEPREGAPAGDAGEVRDFYREIIGAIREVDDRTPFLVGARDAYNVLLSDEAFLPERTDVIYTGNILSGKMTNVSARDAYIKALTDMAVTRNVPVYVQQVGRETSADGTLVHMNAGLAALNGSGVHWTYWQWKQNTANANTYGLNYKDGGTGWIAKTAEQARVAYYCAQTYAALEAAAVAAATAAGATLWYIKPDLSNVWQDSAGTTPVTAVGQTVSRVTAVAGSVALSQATATAAPTLTRTPGGHYAMLFDGVDDFIQAASTIWTVTTDNITAVAAGIPAETATNRVFLHCGTSAATLRFPYLGVNATDVGTASWRDDAGATLMQIDGTLNLSDRPLVLSATKVTNDKKLLTNGVQEGATDTGVLGTVSPTRLRIGSASTTTGHFQGPIALVCAGKTMTDTQRQAIERFGALLVGASYPI